MKVSENWMQAVVGDNKLPLAEKDLLERIGSQLGQIDEVSELGPIYAAAVIVRVIECATISGSDHLHSCLIDDNAVVQGVEREDGQHVRVVCGAPNVASGQLVVWLPPGSVVPSSANKDPFKLEARQLMGVTSNGMIASAKELAISDDHEGIVVLSETDGLKPGDSFRDYLQLNDRIIDIENKMFTHRPDLFGQLGVARELSGIYGQAFVSPSWYQVDRPIQTEPSVSLKVDNTLLDDGCPRFMAVSIDNLIIQPSPLWLQSYLSRVGIRPINNLVDLTNYVMMVTGQPLHAYDLDKVGQKRNAELVVRRAQANEQLKLLDGHMVKLMDQDIVIANREKALGLGGVMGGANSEISSNTTAIILECATFDMYAIRRSAMAHGVFSEALTRFTKGQSPLQNRAVLAYALDLLKQLVPAARVISEVVDVKSDQIKPPGSINTSLSLINSYLGVELPTQAMADMLKNVEFSVSFDSEQLRVTPPFWRTDILAPEDVIEEIARLKGYTNLPQALPLRRVDPPSAPDGLRLKNDIRQLLVSGGANELINYSFVDEKLMQASGQDTSRAFKLANAISPQLEYYRTVLLPSLLLRVHPNHKAGYDRFALFELGKIHYVDALDNDQLPLEPERLALIVSAMPKTAKSYYDGPAYYMARAYLDLLLGGLNIDVTTLTFAKLDTLGDQPLWRDNLKLYDPNRSAAITLQDKLVGVIGEFNWSLTKSLKLSEFSAGLEVDLEVLSALCNLSGVAYHPLSRFPSVVQDMTVKAPASTSYQDLVSKLRAKLDTLTTADLQLKLKLIDIYQPEEPDQPISWTFRLTATDLKRTLTDQEVATLTDQLNKQSG